MKLSRFHCDTVEIRPAGCVERPRLERGDDGATLEPVRRRHDPAAKGIFRDHVRVIGRGQMHPEAFIRQLVKGGDAAAARSPDGRGMVIDFDAVRAGRGEASRLVSCQRVPFRVDDGDKGAGIDGVAHHLARLLAAIGMVL